MNSGRQLRVLHCRQGDRVWGAERQILQLAQHLPDYGIAMELVLLRRWGLDPEPHPLAAQARLAGCQVHEVSARPHELADVIRLLHRRLQGCDLLHTHEFKSDLLGMVAARSCRRPWIVTDHHLATDDDPLLRLFGYADRWALARADAVVVPSRSQAQRLGTHVPAERIHVIYHGIDQAEFARSAGNERAAIRQRYQVNESQPVVSVFGRLEPIKGHRYFLQAARHMLQTEPNLRFWIVGDGSLREALRHQVEILGLNGAIQFLGYQSEVAPLMAASDLILLPSHHESFGIVLIEAMSLAKPIVASAAGGIPEVILDGANGFLVPPGDIGHLSRRVLEMLRNPAQAARLGQAGRERVRQVFTIEVMLERMAALYQQVGRDQRDTPMPATERPRSASLSTPA